MELSSFFAPFNIYNVGVFFLTLLIFDALGAWVAEKLQFPSFLRIAYWVFGLALFVTLWFGLHLFIPFAPNYVMTSLIVLGVVTLPWYFLRIRYWSLLKSIFQFPLVWLFVLPVVKPLFFLTSLPPYQWDELAYHFYAPAKLFTETSWTFINPYSCKCWGLYEMIPHFLETAFTLFLSLTSTYATARLLHLLIFLTVVSAIGSFLKKHFSWLVAGLYVFFALYLNPSPLTSSTLGYVDAATSVMAVLYVVMGVNFLYSKQKGDLMAAVATAAIALAIKYSVIGFIAATTLVLTLGGIIEFRREISQWMADRKNTFKAALKLLTVLVATALLFGGYWYVKNAVITGNPIYPFVFPCKPEFQCGQQKQFFAGWSVAFEWQNFETIRNDLFTGYANLANFFMLVLIISPVAGVIFKKKKLVILSLVILTSLLLEIMVTRQVTSFVGRYFLHWVLLVPMVLPLLLVIPIQWSAPKLWYTISLLLVVSIAYKTWQIPVAISRIQLNKLRAESYVAPEYRNYARYRYSLHEWIKDTFPNTDEVISWCGESRSMTKLFVADPSLIWSSYEGMMRGFLVNCDMVVLPVVEPGKMEAFIEELKQEHPGAYVASYNTCHPEKPTLGEQDYDYSYRNHYELNQKIICSRTPVRESMYQL